MVAAVLGRKEASALQIDVLRPRELPANAMALVRIEWEAA